MTKVWYGHAMHCDFQPAVYIMASTRNGTIYTGVTSNLVQRIAQHRGGGISSFSADHGTNILVWFEQHSTMEHAIVREKRIKKWNRSWKLELIEKENPTWRDLAEDFGFDKLDQESGQ